MAEMLAGVWQEKDEIWFGKRKEKQCHRLPAGLLFDEFFILWERVIWGIGRMFLYKYMHDENCWQVTCPTEIAATGCVLTVYLVQFTLVDARAAFADMALAVKTCWQDM
jgi:hypothetical protein